MAKIIECRDCLLPSFIHSPPFQVPAAVPGLDAYILCGGFLFVLCRRNDRWGLVALAVDSVASAIAGDDRVEALANLIVITDAWIVLDLENVSRISLASNDKDAIFVSSEAHAIYIRHSESGIWAVSDRVTLCSSIACITPRFIQTEPGELYMSQKSIGVTCDLFAAINDGVLFSNGSEFSFRHENGTINKIAMTNLPKELTLDDSKICGLTVIDKDRIVFLGTSDSGQNILVVFATFTSTSLECTHYSMNELYLSSDDGVGILKYVASRKILFVGHTMADAVAVFKFEEKDIVCLVSPEGKQIGCSLINGEADTCLLKTLAWNDNTVISVPSGNELVETHFLVCTGQRDGWITFHFMEEKNEPTSALPVIESKSPVALAVLSPAVKPPAALAAPAPPMFNPAVKPPAALTAPAAAAPPMFNPAVKPAAALKAPAAAAAPPMFNPAVKPPAALTAPAAAAPPMFNPAVKPAAALKAPAAAAPPMFNPAVKPPAAMTAPAAAEPPMFNPAVKPAAALKAPAAAAPPMFNPAVKPPAALTAPAAAPPTMFNPAVKPPGALPTSTGTGLFAQPAQAAGSLFGSFGAIPATPQKEATPGVGLFGQPTQPTTSTGLFGQPAQPGPSAGLFGQPAQPGPSANLFSQAAKGDASTGLFQTASTFGSFGSTATPSVTSGGLFGQPAQSSGGLFGQPAQSSGGSFGQPAQSSGGLFGQPAQSSGGLFGQPAQSSGGLFGQPAQPSASTTPSAVSVPAIPSTKTESSKEAVKATENVASKSTGPTIPSLVEGAKSLQKHVAADSVCVGSPSAKSPKLVGVPSMLLDSFEAELAKFEAINLPKVKVNIPQVPQKLNVSIPTERVDALRQAVQAGEKDVSGIRETESEILQELRAKVNELEAKIDKANALLRNSKRKIAKNVPATPPARAAHSMKSPMVIQHHPLPPSMRKEPIGLISPLRTPDRRFAATPIKTTRSSPPLLKPTRMSLSEMLTGKIRGSPPAIPAPVIGDHGMAWQLLRQVEQHEKEIDVLTRKLAALEK